jgi:DNA (cytosine-5)-methyltransferase 1
MNSEAPNSLRLARHKEQTVERFSKIINMCEKSGTKGVVLSDKVRAELGIKKQSIVVLNEKQPSHTITTLPDDIIHYSEPRILTVRECARLQSFPDWFEFRGNYTTGGSRRTKECPRYTQVGNAVPPLLAEFLGTIVIALHERKQ